MVLNMDSFKKKNSKFALILSVTCLSVFIGSVSFNVFEGKFQKLNAAEVVKDDTTEEVGSPLPDDVKLSVDRVFRDAHDWPQTIDINKKKAKIEYAFNDQLDAYIKKLLKSYRSDYATVAVIDNESGEVLAAVGVEGKTNMVDTSLVLNSTHPSASLIKMVTAAELLQNAKITRDTEFEFRGRSTTLFKYQLDDSKNQRWDKTQNFETAFAKSNNVIFGKAAIRNISSEKLSKMAYNFGFNQTFIQELDFVRSYIGHAETGDDYRLAELASGYNDETVISPIHAAMMASIVANNGIMKNPKVISKIVDAGNGQTIWENTALEKRVLLPETTKEMREMMEMTVDGGTARKSFGKMNTGYKNALQMGGKTGSITGGKPFGKRDWFAAYAIPRDIEQGKGISISVMNVNVKRWHVKSTMLAKNIIEYYYNEVRPVPITMVKMPRMASGRSRKPRIYKRGVASSRSKKKEYASQRNRKSSKKEIGRRNERKSNTTI
jgi:cell division protein FtsI/penicillin-binding protein 2